MIPRALIGYSGFVGSNLRTQETYTDFFNSANFRELSGRAFNEVTCAGISAVKWLANKEPEKDWAGIRALLDVLETVRIRRFVLISTIDVYPDPSKALAEDAVLEGLSNHSYGSHRLAIEKWVSERFEDHLIVRLPALFGPGLKKNYLYDLLNNNGVDKINPAAEYQWYPVDRLSDDIARADAEEIRLVNLFTAPLTMRTIADSFFPDASVGPTDEPAPVYNLRTRHASIFGGHGGFIMNAESVISALARYVADELGRRAAVT